MLRSPGPLLTQVLLILTLAQLLVGTRDHLLPLSMSTCEKRNLDRFCYVEAENISSFTHDIPETDRLKIQRLHVYGRGVATWPILENFTFKGLQVSSRSIVVMIIGVVQGVVVVVVEVVVVVVEVATASYRSSCSG